MSFFLHLLIYLLIHYFLFFIIIFIIIISIFRPYKLHPASSEALGSLKVVIMTTETKLDQNECSICQEDLEPGQEIVFMPDCNHSFHNECVLRWFRLVCIKFLLI